MAAIVTGASSGIGAAFARLLARQGYDVVVVARRVERLKSLAAELEDRHGIAVTPIRLDLASPDAAAELERELEHSGEPVDVLVNNAGYEVDGPFLSSDWPTHEAHARVLALLPTELIHRFLPGMLERGSGRVVNVASVGGLLPCVPNEGLYAPAKHFIVALTRALAIEYAGRGVSFTVSCPGGTSTELLDRGNAARLASSMPRFTIQSAEDVAAQTWAAAVAGRAVVVPGWPNKVTTALVHHLPQRVAQRAMARAFRADLGDA